MGSRILDFPAASSHVPKVYETAVYSQVYKLFVQGKQCYSPIQLLSCRMRDGGLGGYWKSTGLQVKNEIETQKNQYKLNQLTKHTLLTLTTHFSVTRNEHPQETSKKLP